MTVRRDVLEGLKGEMSTWYYEAAEPLYKKQSKMYDKIAEVRPMSDINMGGYWKGTSAIGPKQLQKRSAGSKLYEDLPLDGYTVYATVFDVALKVKCPLELKRDWKRTGDWLRDYVKKNWPAAVEEAKEDLVFEYLNKGGYTSGDDAFNNDSGDIGLSTYTSPKLCYDGKPWFAKSGNEHTAKDTNTYYNAYAEATTDFDLAKKMWNRYAQTNAKMENGRPLDFASSNDTIVVCAGGLGLDWDIVNNSTLQPNTANNPKNPLKGRFKEIIETTRITTATQSIIGKEKSMMTLWLGTPIFNFWEDNDPPCYWASVILPYARAVRNWRFAVSNNAPVS